MLEELLVRGDIWKTADWSVCLVIAAGDQAVSAVRLTMMTASFPSCSLLLNCSNCCSCPADLVYACYTFVHSLYSLILFHGDGSSVHDWRWTTASHSPAPSLPSCQCTIYIRSRHSMHFIDNQAADCSMSSAHSPIFSFHSFAHLPPFAGRLLSASTDQESSYC